MNQKLIQTSIQLEPGISQAIDEWQKQRFIRSRSSAINQLLAQALGLATVAQTTPQAPQAPQAPTVPNFEPSISPLKWGN